MMLTRENMSIQWVTRTPLWLTRQSKHWALTLTQRCQVNPGEYCCRNELLCCDVKSIVLWNKLHWIACPMSHFLPTLLQELFHDSPYLTIAKLNLLSDNLTLNHVLNHLIELNLTKFHQHHQILSDRCQHVGHPWITLNIALVLVYMPHSTAHSFNQFEAIHCSIVSK